MKFTCDGGALKITRSTDWLTNRVCLGLNKLTDWRITDRQNLVQCRPLENWVARTLALLHSVQAVWFQLSVRDEVKVSTHGYPYQYVPCADCQGTSGAVHRKLKLSWDEFQYLGPWKGEVVKKMDGVLLKWKINSPTIFITKHCGDWFDQPLICGT